MQARPVSNIGSAGYTKEGRSVGPLGFGQEVRLAERFFLLRLPERERFYALLLFA